MRSIVGIDSRIFKRENRKRNGEIGHFESILGIAVKVKNYIEYDQKYQKALQLSFEDNGREMDYLYYCMNDIKDYHEKYNIMQTFAENISKNIEKIHIFYTLFSKKRQKEVKVYGRLSKRNHIKLSKPTRTYEELRNNHLLNTFPSICAWKLSHFLHPDTIEYHLDSYEGHINAAQEEIEKNGYIRYVYTNGDCSNPVISTADLLIDLLDTRLKEQNKYLLFDNIRPALPEFGDNVLVYPISNKHLPYITPLDKVPIDNWKVLKHPVFWAFKGESLIDSGTMKRSPLFRNLIDYAARQYGIVKMFSKKDIEYFQPGDYGVYFNSMGKEIIESYIKIGIKFKLLDMSFLIPNKGNE